MSPVLYTSGYGCYLKEREVTTMRQHTNALKQNTNSVYNSAEQNKITSSNQMEQTLGDMELAEFVCGYKGKEVKVVLEFPTDTNEKAERVFIDTLKNVYLEKVKIRSIQKKESALSSVSTKDMEV